MNELNIKCKEGIIIGRKHGWSTCQIPKNTLVLVKTHIGEKKWYKLSEVGLTEEEFFRIMLEQTLTL